MRTHNLLLLALLASTACVEPYVEVFRPVALGDSPARGGADAWVTIVEFGDFECPYCGKGAQTLAEIERAYGEDVRIVFKHLPLEGHPRALPAAVAAECAHAQGRFWGLYERLFAAEGALSGDDLERYAAEAGLEMDEWSACLSTDGPRARIEADVAQAEAVGVVATPSFFVNGWLLEGAQPFADFRQLVDRELERAKASGFPRERYYEVAVLGGGSSGP